MNNTIVKEAKLIAVYARVSTSVQEIQETIEAQLLQVRKFADDHGYTIVKEYLDNGWSGSILARPELDRLRQDTKKKIWEAVLVYDPDRIARNGSYQELVREELEEAGVQLLFVTVPPPKNDEDRVMNKMRGVFAEYEKMKITERFRIGKLRRIDMNDILLSEAPYGYTYIPNTGKKGTAGYLVGHLEINEKEAEVIRMIFTWVADEGYTLRAVVRKLNELGIKPRKSKRGVWSTSTLSTLLRNQTYIGKAHWGASIAIIPEKPLKEQKYKKIKKTSRKIRPESEWLSVTVPRLVEDDLFYRAGQKLRDNFATMGRNKKNDYLLAGKIWCTCGRRRAGEGPQHGKHLYYRCTDRVYSFPLPRTCIEGGINARISDDIVWQRLKKFMTTPELMHAQIEAWMNSDKNNNLDKSVIDIESTKINISKLEEREKRYTNAFSEKVITLERLKEHLEPLQDEIAALKKNLTQAYAEQKPELKMSLPSETEIQLFAKDAVEVINTLNFSSKKAMIAKSIDRVFSTQKDLQLYGSIDLYDIYVNFFTVSRNCRPPKCR